MDDVGINKNMIYIISGPPAAGKSTVSQKLAETLALSALIHGDSIHHMIISGHLAPWEDENQQDLKWVNTKSLTTNFIRRGFDVVIDDVAFPNRVDQLGKDMHSESIRIKYVILLAHETTLLQRDKERLYHMDERCLILLKEFQQHSSMSKHFLHTDSKTVEQLVASILQDSNFLYD